jgi:hypothetical protein
MTSSQPRRGKQKSLQVSCFCCCRYLLLVRLPFAWRCAAVVGGWRFVFGWGWLWLIEDTKRAAGVPASGRGQGKEAPWGLARASRGRAPATPTT